MPLWGLAHLSASLSQVDMRAEIQKEQGFAER